MKQIAIIAAMLLTASLCLGQVDSGKTAADTTKTSVQIDQTTGDSTTVTVTTEKGKTDSTTTVVIRREGHGRERDQRMRRRRDWVLGCRMNNLAFKNFPGTVFLQRRVCRSGFVGMGFRYTDDQMGPSQQYSQHDSFVSGSSTRRWNLALYPEYVVVRGTGSWVGSVTLRGIYEYHKECYTNSSDNTGTDNSSHYETASTYRTARYGVEIPVAVERRFRIGNMVFSAGLAGQFISAVASDSKNEYTSYNRYTSTTGGTTSNSSQSRSKEKIPLSLVINSPFNGTASIQLKYWF